MNKEKLICECCGKSSFSKLWKKGKFTYLRCNFCSLVIEYPQPSFKESKLNYNSEDYCKKRSRVDIILTNIENYKKEVIKKFVKYKKTGNLLDVGCYKGFFVYAAKKQGWKAKGLEINKNAAEYGEKNLKLDIIVKDFLKYNPKTSFDVITMNDLIEHVKSPRAFIRKSKQLLRKGGCLYLYTPNFRSIPRFLLGKTWKNIDPVHLYYFSPSNLKRILKEEGFLIRKCLTIGLFDGPNKTGFLNKRNKSFLKNLLKIYYFIKYLTNLPFRVLHLPFGSHIEVIAVKKK